MIEFRESIVVVLLVREQPRYKVIQNITQYTNLQLFFSETFISLVLQNSICIPFAKAQRENGTTNTRQKNDVDRQSGKPIIFQPSA